MFAIIFILCFTTSYTISKFKESMLRSEFKRAAEINNKPFYFDGKGQMWIGDRKVYKDYHNRSFDRVTIYLKDLYTHEILLNYSEYLLSQEPKELREFHLEQERLLDELDREHRLKYKNK